MIDEETVDLLVERLIRRIELMNTYFLMEMGSSIKKIKNLTPSEAQKLVQILKYGGNYEEMIQELSKYTGLNTKDLDKIFKAYAKKDQMFYKDFYEYRNKPFIPFDENEVLKAHTEALSNIAKQEMYNFTRSNVLGYTIRDINGTPRFLGLQETYNRVLDDALLSVSEGKETFNSSMSRIMKEIGGSGLKTIEYESGRSMRLDSAIRMHLKGRLRELHNENQKIIGEEIGADGVEITVHENPAIDHENAQGKQFSNAEYEKLQNGDIARTYDGEIITLNHDGKNGYRPISEMNCYHRFYSIILGISKPTYSKKELDDIKKRNEKGFDFDGKHYTMYEGTQLQRQLERKIREQKDIQIFAKASGNMELVDEAQHKITQLTNKYKELSNVSELPLKKDRLLVSGYKRTKVNVQKPKENNIITAYHSSRSNFDKFDPRYIPPEDPDFPFNGFFFTENEEGAGQYFNSDYVYKVELDLTNKATSKDLIDTLKELNSKYDIYDDSEIPSRSRSWGDEVRYMMLDKGFDGMQTRGVDLDEASKVLKRQDVYEYKTPLGNDRKLERVNDGYMYYENERPIYKYDTLQEWKQSNPNEYVVFNPNKIKIIKKKKKS